MAKRSVEILVPNDHSLHLRPMQELVEKAVAFNSRLSVSRGGRLADAKSIFDVMMLAAEKGPLVLDADGSDADLAVKTLTGLLNAILK